MSPAVVQTHLTHDGRRFDGLTGSQYWALPASRMTKPGCLLYITLGDREEVLKMAFTQIDKCRCIRSEFCGFGVAVTSAGDEGVSGVGRDDGVAMLPCEICPLAMAGAQVLTVPSFPHHLLCSPSPSPLPRCPLHAHSCSSSCPLLLRPLSHITHSRSTSITTATKRTFVWTRETSITATAGSQMLMPMASPSTKTLLLPRATAWVCTE